MYDHDHVTGHITVDGMSSNVQGRGVFGGSHGNAQDCHGDALTDHVDGVNCGGLEILLKVIGTYFDKEKGFIVVALHLAVNKNNPYY